MLWLVMMTESLLDIVTRKEPSRWAEAAYHFLCLGSFLYFRLLSMLHIVMYKRLRLTWGGQLEQPIIHQVQ